MWVLSSPLLFICNGLPFEEPGGKSLLSIKDALLERFEVLLMFREFLRSQCADHPFLVVHLPTVGGCASHALLFL